MFYERSKATNIVALLSVVMIVFGIFYSSTSDFITNLPVLFSFIVVNILIVYFTETNKILIYLLAFTYVASSVVIRTGYFGVDFNFLNPIVFLVFAYVFIERKQVSITLSAVALGLLCMNIIQMVVIDPIIFPALIGSILFYIGFLLNVLNIHSVTVKEEERKILD